MAANRKGAERMSTRERSLLVSTCFGHFMSHFNMLVFPALVLPLAGVLRLSLADVLGISFWMYLLFGLSALAWGMLADRLGGRHLLFLFYLGSGASALAASIWMEKPAALMTCLAFLGLFSGIYHPVGLGMISKEIRRVSMGMGLNGMFGNLGLAAAPLLAGTAHWLWGPRSAYLVVAGLNLLGLVLMTLFPLGELSRSGRETASGENGYLAAFFILLVAMMLGGIAYRGSTVIMPTYFELKIPWVFQALSAFSDSTLSGNLVANVVTSIIFLVGMPGQFAGGHLAERFDPRKCYLLFHAVTVPAAFFMSMACDVPLIALALVYFFLLLGMQPIENTLVALFIPKRFHHSAYGMKFVLTFGVGSLAVKMVEAIEVHSGLESVFIALGFVSLALVGIILLLIGNTAKIRHA